MKEDITAMSHNNESNSGADETATTKRNELSKKTGSRRVCVTIGFVLVLVGWLTMMLNEWVSLFATVAGLVLSCIGVRIPAGPRRNFAITAIIAASVLLLVFAIFATILYLI